MRRSRRCQCGDRLHGWNGRVRHDRTVGYQREIGWKGPSIDTGGGPALVGYGGFCRGLGESDPYGRVGCSDDHGVHWNI